MMNTQLPLPKPWFELKGLLALVDLSAWLSGLSYGLGIWFIGLDLMAHGFLANDPKFWCLPITFIVFIGAVLAIQKHMKLALQAMNFGEPKHLVTSGIFRYSRNPIYLAFLLPLATQAVFSPLAALLSCGLYLVLMTVTVIRKEERDLLANFGEEFIEYANKTPRWI